MVWRIRRCQDTPNGVLCTLALLDVIVKDQAKIITDKSVLITLYSFGVTKFINFSSSFNIKQQTMYRSANILGIDSFIVDLRHLCAHGKEVPSIEVFRKSADYCMSWLKNFYWEREMENISDTTINEMLAADSLNFEHQAKDLLVIFDVILEAISKSSLNRAIEQVLKEDDTQMDPSRWKILIDFIRDLKKDSKPKKMRDVLMQATDSLTNFMGSKEMCQWFGNFFNIFSENCNYFLSITDNCTDSSEQKKETEVDEPANKKPKRTINPNQSIVSLTKDFIVGIAKQDYLKHFLEHLFQVAKNSPSKTKSAHFWIQTILKSFNYFQEFCSHFENLQDIMVQEKASAEILDFYTGTLHANLQDIYVFVGAQIMPNSVKFTAKFLEELLKELNVENKEICLRYFYFNVDR